MQRNMTILALLAVVAAVTGAIGCSSSTGPGTGSSGSGAMVSFSKDVIPIFQQSCTISMECHGQPNNAGELNLYLGSHGDSVSGPNTPATIMMAYQGLVGVNSVEDPAMALVKIGDTANSYLVHKLNGDQNSTTAIASECAKMLCASSDCTTSTPCGALMPDTSAVPIPMDQITTITNWISQGAANN